MKKRLLKLSSLLMAAILLSFTLSISIAAAYPSHNNYISDKALILDDETKEIAKEIVASGRMGDIFIALDYFDASINRVAAWTAGLRNFRKALLIGMLTPNARFTELQNEGRMTELLVLQEEIKAYPWGAVYEEYCERLGVPVGEKWLDEVLKYEKEILSNR